MALVHVVDRAGIEHQIAASTGGTLMETLREFDFGVAAICGGMCSCATCHVYVDPAWADKLPPPEPNERDIVQELAHAQPTSRLSCQVDVTPNLAGLRIAIAPDE
jgi:ferredoxin, 2Fe-2S